MKNEIPEEWGYEAKFAVRTDFLDTTFRRSRQQREGETYAQFVAETHAIFVGMVHQLQTQEAAMRQFLGVQNPPTEFRYSEPYTSPSSPMPIIDRSSKEKLEIAIDNADSLETLSTLKEEASKHNLVSLYMSKLKSLINE